MALLAVPSILSICLYSQKVAYFIPTSEAVRIGWMAARDEGYALQKQSEWYLDELRAKDGKEPYDGYTSIALYRADSASPIRSYAIRIETGDVIDPEDCLLFRYADLMAFRSKITRDSGAKVVTPSDIASEVGCKTLKILPANPVKTKRESPSSNAVETNKR